MSPKEARTHGNQGRETYQIARFMMEAFKDVGTIAYLEELTPDQISRLSVQEAREITYKINKGNQEDTTSKEYNKRKNARREETPEPKRIKYTVPNSEEGAAPETGEDTTVPDYLKFLDDLFKE